MQSVDNNIINDLNKDGLVLGGDYQVYRYVDDYFIFIMTMMYSIKLE